MDPFEIEECSAPTGRACGSVYLDQSFENLVRTKLGRKAESIITEQLAAEIMSQFDTIKRKFNPFDNGCESEYEIGPLRGAPEMPDIGLMEGYLKISKYIISSLILLMLNREDIETVFAPVFKQILDLVQEQIRNMKSRHEGKTRVV